VQESTRALVKLRNFPAGTVLQPIVVPLKHSPACLPAYQLLPQFGVMLEIGESVLSLTNPADEQDSLCSASP